MHQNIVTVPPGAISLRDETVAHGFADMVSTGNERLAAYLASTEFRA